MHFRPFMLLLALLCVACGEPQSTSPADPADVVDDLGTLDAKADGAVLRTVRVHLSPGQTRRFRIRTTGFRASFDQETAGQMQLSAVHYDIEAKGEAAEQPTLEATADDTVRNWTLRVSNLSDVEAKGELLVTEWTEAEPEPPFVGELGEELRREAVAVEPGDIKTFRIRTTRFHARLTQDGDVPARLSAKHYDIEIEGETGAAPTIQAIADVDELRNWTLRVENHGDTLLEAELVVHALIGQPAIELGIISDIDKTIMPPETSAGLTPPYAGMVTLLNRLEFRQNGTEGDMYFVTARNPARAAEVPEYFKHHGVPDGPISTGISGVPWIAQAEKVRDISAILDANPDQRFVLFGDTSHRDPDAYREIIAKYPGRIISAYIHHVKNIRDDRVEGVVVHHGYAEVAASLWGLGLLDEDEAQGIVDEVVAETELTEAEGKAFMDAQRGDE
jgi:hypothetical protein